mmetsp:Transcript_3307/g.7954  ORF Transcript_3307/g.7954 Transcript_3307/m.7954 type:complete len:230 (-) Transcript_3307:870-1559(-)
MEGLGEVPGEVVSGAPGQTAGRRASHGAGAAEHRIRALAGSLPSGAGGNRGHALERPELLSSVITVPVALRCRQPTLDSTDVLIQGVRTISSVNMCRVSVRPICAHRHRGHPLEDAESGAEQVVVVGASGLSSGCGNGRRHFLGNDVPAATFPPHNLVSLHVLQIRCARISSVVVHPGQTIGHVIIVCRRGCGGAIGDVVGETCQLKPSAQLAIMVAFSSIGLVREGLH